MAISPESYIQVRRYLGSISINGTSSIATFVSGGSQAARTVAEARKMFKANRGQSSASLVFEEVSSKLTMVYSTGIEVASASMFGDEFVEYAAPVGGGIISEVVGRDYLVGTWVNTAKKSNEPLFRSNPENMPYYSMAGDVGAMQGGDSVKGNSTVGLNGKNVIANIPIPANLGLFMCVKMDLSIEINNEGTIWSALTRDLNYVSNPDIAIATNDQGLIRLKSQAKGGTASTGFTIVSGQQYVICLRRYSNGDCQFFVDGELVFSTTGVYRAGAQDRFSVLAGTVFGSWPGNVGACTMISRVPTDAEVVAYSAAIHNTFPTLIMLVNRSYTSMSTSKIPYAQIANDPSGRYTTPVSGGLHPRHVGRDFLVGTWKNAAKNSKESLYRSNPQNMPYYIAPKNKHPNKRGDSVKGNDTIGMNGKNLIANVAVPENLGLFLCIKLVLQEGVKHEGTVWTALTRDLNYVDNPDLAISTDGQGLLQVTSEGKGGIEPTGFTMVSGHQYVVCLTRNANGDAQFFVDGNLVYSTTGAVQAGAHGRFAILAGMKSGSWPGYVGACVMLARVPTDAEVRDYSAAIYDHFPIITLPESVAPEAKGRSYVGKLA